MTPKQQRFVEEYLVDLNATQAAIRAGYSKKTAEQQGHQLLKKTSVQQAVSAAQQTRSEATGITADRVVTELAKVGLCQCVQLTRNRVRHDSPVEGLRGKVLSDLRPSPHQLAPLARAGLILYASGGV